MVEYVYEEGSRSRDVIRNFFKTLDNLNLTVTTDGYAAHNLYPSEIGRLVHSVLGCELCNQKRYV